MTATATLTAPAPTTCRRCGRKLTSTKAVAIGYGATCARKVKADTTAYSPEQAAKAVRLVQDGGVTRIPSKHFRLYTVQGTYTTYQTDGIDCTCRGASDHGSCYHALAASLFEAARHAGLVTRRYALAA